MKRPLGGTVGVVEKVVAKAVPGRISQKQETKHKETQSLVRWLNRDVSFGRYRADSRVPIMLWYLVSWFLCRIRFRLVPPRGTESRVIGGIWCFLGDRSFFPFLFSF